MSEEKKNDVFVSESRLFFLAVDEVNMALLSRVMPGVQFCAVHGVELDTLPDSYLLANPKPPKQEEKNE